MNRIAVLRAGGIGDLMFVLPALKSLRSGYPHAELTLLATDWQGDLVAGRGIVDRVIDVPAFDGVRGGTEDATAIDEFFERMAGERFDLAVQLHGGGRHSNVFVRRLGARMTAGLRTPDAVSLDINVPFVYLQSEVMRLLEVTEALGCEPAEAEPSLPVIASDLELGPRAQALVERDAPLVLLSPGASDPRRRWPVESFAAAGRALVQAGATVGIVGSAEDGPLARAIELEAQGTVALAGELPLKQFAGFASLANLLVGNDSGPLNLARAVGTPTVGVYWVGNLINAAAMTRTRHRPLAAWQSGCPRCGAGMIYSQCDHGESFVAEVTVDEVLYNALDLLHGQETCRSGRLT